MKAAPGNRREDDRVQPTHVALKLEVNENKQRHGQWETQKIDQQDKAGDPAKNINDAAARDLGWHVIRKIKIHGGAFDCIAPRRSSGMLTDRGNSAVLKFHPVAA